jgi:hypothetical protein
MFLFEDRSLHPAQWRFGGAIFEASIDRFHPINFDKNEKIAFI